MTNGSWTFTRCKRCADPGRPAPRRPILDDDVRTLLAAAESQLLEALANDTGTPATTGPRHRAELDLLLVRLAADTGARRGELTALRIEDLDGRTLHIQRAVSAGVLTTPKSGHGRTMTIGTTTANLWHSLAADWQDRAGHPVGPWLFTADTAHERRLGAEVLGHRSRPYARSPGYRTPPGTDSDTGSQRSSSPGGRSSKPKQRLGHADAATTLREYAHALPLTDQHVADTINTHLDTAMDPTRAEATTSKRGTEPTL